MSYTRLGSDRICRLCGSNDERFKIYYGPRHYAHLDCYAAKKGFNAVIKLPKWVKNKVPLNEGKRAFCWDMLISEVEK